MFIGMLQREGKKAAKWPSYDYPSRRTYSSGVVVMMVVIVVAVTVIVSVRDAVSVFVLVLMVVVLRALHRCLRLVALSFHPSEPGVDFLKHRFSSL
jgi:hypothetical protein